MDCILIIHIVTYNLMEIGQNYVTDHALFCLTSGPVIHTLLCAQFHEQLKPLTIQWTDCHAGAQYYRTCMHGHTIKELGHNTIIELACVGYLSVPCPEASSRYRTPASACPMHSSHQVTATIPGYFGCTNWPPKMARYGRSDLVWIRH